MGELLLTTQPMCRQMPTVEYWLCSVLCTCLGAVSQMDAFFCVMGCTDLQRLKLRAQAVVHRVLISAATMPVLAVQKGSLRVWQPCHTADRPAVGSC